jgi:AcrR family transcriptional regulator
MASTAHNPADTHGPDQLREAQRQRIMEAARTVFARSGFHGASIQEIRAEAGMSAGNLYRYFPSKEAIIAEIAEADRVHIAEMFDHLDRVEDPIAGLMALGQHFLDEMCDPKGSAMCAEIMAESIRNPEIRRMFERNMEIVRGGIARALVRGVQTGQVDPALDLDMAVRLIVAFGDGVALHRALAPDWDRRLLGRQFERMILCFLAPSHPQPPADAAE